MQTSWYNVDTVKLCKTNKQTIEMQMLSINQVNTNKAFATNSKKVIKIYSQFSLTFSIGQVQVKRKKKKKITH